MEPSIQKQPITNRIRYIHIIFTGLIFVLLGTSCQKPTSSFTYVKCKEVSYVTNYSKMILFGGNEYTDSIDYIMLPVSDGDILMPEDEVFIFERDLQEVKWEFNDGIGKVNDKIYMISIPKDESILSRFAEMEGKDLSVLRLIQIEEKFNEKYLPWLKEFADRKPEVGLFLDNLKDLERISGLFNPKHVLASGSNSDLALLSDFRNLELLFLEYDDSTGTAPIPELSGLKYLQIEMYDYTEEFVENMFANNPQLEKITINEPEYFDIATLKPLKRLRELIITNAERVDNLNTISDYKTLELLSLKGENMQVDLGDLNLNQLKWITIDEGVDQTEFDNFVSRHPGLEFIELVQNERIESLQSLRTLNQLRGLILTDCENIDYNSITSLKNLEYLSVSEDIDSETVDKLTQALPQTYIGTSEGFCLGSGWLLLLLPMVVFLILLRRKEVTKDGHQ